MNALSQEKQSMNIPDALMLQFAQKILLSIHDGTPQTKKISLVKFLLNFFRNASYEDCEAFSNSDGWNIIPENILWIIISDIHTHPYGHFLVEKILSHNILSLDHCYIIVEEWKITYSPMLEMIICKVLDSSVRTDEMEMCIHIIHEIVYSDNDEWQKTFQELLQQCDSHNEIKQLPKKHAWDKVRTEKIRAIIRKVCNRKNGYLLINTILDSLLINPIYFEDLEEMSKTWKNANTELTARFIQLTEAVGREFNKPESHVQRIVSNFNTIK